MADVRTGIKLTPWPSPQDYNEAIQNLVENTQDAQLKSGAVHTSALGLPRSVTGAFASVYRVGCGGTDVAVRCFLRDISDQEARYKLISEFVQNDSLPYTVAFDFMVKGIRVGAAWYPALKMDWVDGTNLDLFIERHLESAEKLAHVASLFKQMCADLRDAGIAHGDLQHGNIIVCGDELRLVDYDGMYVPAMQGMQANELGHRNFQHPLRTEKEFGPHLDNFSSWVIYTSLRAVALDPTLWELLGGGDDCLLFRRDDFVEPEHSYSFAVLEHHPNEEIRKLAKFLRWQCHNAVRDVPALTDEMLTPPSFIGELTSAITKTRTAPRTFAQAPAAPAAAQQKSLPEWIHADRAVSAVIAARQRPKAPPVRVQPGASALDLKQQIPRLAVRARSDVDFFTAAQHRVLVENAEAVPTENFSCREILGLDNRKFYMASYSFRTPRSRRLVEFARPISRGDFQLLQGLNQATVLCDPLDPAQHAIYEAMAYRAVKPIIPTGIEDKLRASRRVAKFRDESGAHPLLISLVLALPMLCSMGAGIAVGPWLTCLLAGIWATVFFGIWYNPTRDSMLVERGIPARAVVQNVGIRGNGDRAVEYSFMSIRGNINSSVVIHAHEGVVQKGDVLTVLYDLNKPENNVLYKFAQHFAE